MTESSVVCVSQTPSAAMAKETTISAHGQQQQPRRKRFAPRTRTGCLTCRVRRIKCDETRPACQRCTRAWRPCGGYSLPPPLPLAAGDTHLRPTPVAPASAAELAFARYYAAEIGAVAADEFNECFWRRDVPQLGRAAPAVWHATNALAGATWAARDRSAPAGAGAGAVAVVERESARQYSLAVRHVLQLTTTTGEKRPEPRDQTAVLLASVLLASYAVCVGERAVFASIVAASRRLVRQWAFWECLDVSSVAAAAAQILYVHVKAERVAEEFHLEVSGAAAAASRPPGRWLEALTALQRRPLTSTLRACLELDAIWNSLHDILDALPLVSTAEDAAAVYAARQPFVPLFAAWEARYEAYTAPRLRSCRGAPLDVDVAALDLRRALVSVLLRVIPVGSRCRRSETCWDPFTRDFAAAVAALEAALPAATAAAVATGAVLSTPSIYASCNFVAQKCRAPGLRRRAAAVLRSPLVAALGRKISVDQQEDADRRPPLIVDRMMLVEESAWEVPGEGCEEPDDGCVPGRYICNLHRVARVHIDRTVAGPPEITFLTVGDILNGRPGHREAMDISLSSCAMGE